MAFSATLLAVYFCYRLWGEIRGEIYWFFFLLAAVLLGLHSAFEVILTLEIHAPMEILESLTELVEMGGGLSLAYASFGLVKSMKRIRLTMEKE